jgi:ribosomal protein S18 acetylase RimI-like enzyme
MPAMEAVIRRGAAEDVERLKPLWRDLHAHHASLPGMPPVRDLDDSWDHRRRQYFEWLGGEDHTLLIAEREGGPVGYAMVSVYEGAATWDLGERTGEIETLSVLESERGSGVGAALTREAIAVAEQAGARRMAVGVAHTNDDAIRFYEREGFGRFYVLMLR